MSYLLHSIMRRTPGIDHICIPGIGQELAYNGGSCGGISLKRVKRHILGIGLELACNGGSCGGISLQRVNCHILGIGLELL